MRPRAVALAAITLITAPLGARAAAPMSWSLRLEGGAEADSNPAHVETVDGVPSTTNVPASPALRLVSAGDFGVGFGPGHTLSLSGALAGKRYLHTDAQSEDLLVAEGRGDLFLLLGEATAVDLGAAYYDVFQRARSVTDARDFRSAAPAVRLERRFGDAHLFVGGGWRWFTFKPDATLDFAGPSAIVGYRHSLLHDPTVDAADWDWATAATFELRGFTSSRCLTLGDCPPTTPQSARQDRFLALQADVTRTAGLLFGAGLALQLNDSNSYGQSLERLVGHLRAVVLLPWELSLAARAELVATRYRDPVPVGYDAGTGAFVSVEDEGRSSFRLDLARPLGRFAEIGARYTLWTSAPTGGRVAFQRQTGLFYLALLLAP